MDLEPIMQNEVSQKEKNKYHVLMHNMLFRKWYRWNLFAGREQRGRHRGWTDGHRG